jgi:TonB family protein
MIRFLPVIALALTPTSLLAQTANTVDVLGTSTHAVAIKKDAPKYPRRALNQGIEGWIVVGYTILKDGSTSDIFVIDASIDNYFEKAAMEAVEGWKYEPATLDGQAVDEAGKTGRLTFVITDQWGVTGSFQASFDKAFEALDANDLETAREIIDELDQNKRRLMAEVFYLDVLELAYWRKMEDDEKALEHVNRALVMANYNAPEATYIELLRQGVVQSGLANDYQQALDRYATLLEMTPNLPEDDPVHVVASQSQAIIEGNQPIIADAEITECQYCSPKASRWVYSLNRNRFSFDQVQGEINEIVVRCGIRSTSMAYDPKMIWKVERDWGACQVWVYGDEGTSFRIIEHPY